MSNTIANVVKKITDMGISEVEVLALVSDTSYEVVFYGMCKGRMLQSNAMVEENLVSADVIDTFYKETADAVRQNPKFVKGKMNIVKYHKNGELNFAQDEKDCRVYSIKKEWKKSL